MKIKSITIRRGATKSLGPGTYESQRVDFAATAVLEPGDKVKNVERDLDRYVRTKLAAMLTGAKIARESARFVETDDSDFDFDWPHD